MSTMIDQLQAMRAQIDKMIAAGGGDPTAIKTKVTKKAEKAEKSEKKPRANKGQGTAWSAFSSKIQAEHKEELDAVKAEAAMKRKAAKDAGEDAPKDTQGAHLHWCSTYKAEHEAEWLSFKAQWEAEHPKSAPATPAASPEGTADAAAGKKVKAERTPEEKAAAAAKRAAKKAAKDAKKAEEEQAARAASVAEAAEESEEEAAAEPEEDAKSTSSAAAEEETGLSLLPITIKKVNYLRLGKVGEDEEVEWDDAGDVWLALADGKTGAHAGVLNSAGKVVPAPEGHEVPDLS